MNLNKQHSFEKEKESISDDNNDTDDTDSKPKSQKDFVFDSLANILDIEYKPKTNNAINFFTILFFLLF